MRQGLKIRNKFFDAALALFGVLLLWGCSGENSWDCFQTSGPIVQRTFEVDKFTVQVRFAWFCHY